MLHVVNDKPETWIFFVCGWKVFLTCSCIFSNELASFWYRSRAVWEVYIFLKTYREGGSVSLRIGNVMKAPILTRKRVGNKHYFCSPASWTLVSFPQEMLFWGSAINLPSAVLVFVPNSLWLMEQWCPLPSFSILCLVFPLDAAASAVPLLSAVSWTVLWCWLALNWKLALAR